MDKKEITILAKQEFADIYGWLKHWTEHVVDMKRTERNERFFLGNSSYMDLSELLRRNENGLSSPCVIYDTDVHGETYEVSESYIKTHSIYICVLSDDMEDGMAIKQAKDYAEQVALKLVKWFEVCKLLKNKNVVHIDTDRTRIDSTTPFLNGWQAVSLKVVEVVKRECINIDDYV